MGFGGDILANVRRIKRPTVADNFSHECVGIVVDWGISGEYVTRFLDACCYLLQLSAGGAHRQRPGAHQ